MSGVVLYHSPRYFLGGLSLTDLGRLAGQRALGGHLSLISPTLGLEARTTMPGFVFSSHGC